MDIAIVKRGSAADEDRVVLTQDHRSWRAPVHVAHDLPHLVVESLFGIKDGLWGELASQRHPDATQAVTARDPKRRKLGRIVTGAAAAVPTEEWLSESHRLAKTVTNAVANRWTDGPDTPLGVRNRLAREESPAIVRLRERLDDETIALAIRGVKELDRRWTETPPGGILRLRWPLKPAALERVRDES
jgi:hypothetical protein